MCVCVVCLYLCVCVRNETTAPPSLGCSKIYAAFQARSLSQENLNRIVIWNFLKHLKKEISCLSVSSDYRYFLEHTPRGKQGREVRSQKREVLVCKGCKARPLGAGDHPRRARRGGAWLGQASLGIQPESSLSRPLCPLSSYSRPCKTRRCRM